MTKIDIISGFLGAGKTTLIKKLLQEAYGKEQIVLIENEFGEIGIDGGFLKEAGVEIKEMNSGCICCSLVGDFASSLAKVISEYHPDRIIIEPSGVGKLSDVIKAVVDLQDASLQLNALTTIVDGKKCSIYMKNFGEFFNNQIEHAETIIISRTQLLKEAKLQEVVAMLQEHNPKANLITTPWDDIDGKQMLDVMEQRDDMAQKLIEEMEVCPICHHHHEEGHHHEHHHHEEHCTCEHEHEHHHDEPCTCDHEHHHHADEVFTSWGMETIQTYSESQLKNILERLSDSATYGTVLRAKGIVSGENQTWWYYDFVPEEFEIREGNAAPIGKLCVIGSDLNEAKLHELFTLQEV